MMADMIRKAETKQEVLSLLSAYIEAVGSSEKARFLPEEVITSPEGANDLIRRCLGLMGALDAASRRLDDGACAALKEALHTFGNALDRLKSLEREQHRSSDGYPPARSTSNLGRGVFVREREGGVSQAA